VVAVLGRSGLRTPTLHRWSYLSRRRIARTCGWALRAAGFSMSDGERRPKFSPAREQAERAGAILVIASAEWLSTDSTEL